MTSHHTISSIPKYTRYHHQAYILSRQLYLTSQYTSPLLHKVTRAPSDILICQTRSANSSHGLPKYMMIHSPFCSINVTYLLEYMVSLYDISHYL
jgi:hypothetical protein